MSVAAYPVRFDFTDHVRSIETCPDGTFELVDGAISSLVPEGDAHRLTRSAIDSTLDRILDLARYAS